MKQPPQTDDALREWQHLEARRRTALFSSPAGPAFERLITLARHILNVPVIYVSLVDDAEQIFLASTGLPDILASQGRVPLTHSLCRLVVEQDGPIRVDDAAASALLGRHPVVREWGVGAFFGVPVRNASGLTMGAFVAIDLQSRHWTDEEATLLTDLAAMATAEIDLRLAADETRRQSEATRRAEAQISQNDRGYRDVIDSLAEVVFQTDAEGRWTFLNAAWEELTGHTVDFSLGRDAREYLAPEDIGDCASLFAVTGEGARRPPQFRQEIRLAYKDGTYRWIELRARRVTTVGEDGHATLTGTAGTLSDITDRYASIQRLVESELRYRTVVECLGEGLMITDFDDRVQYVNPRMAEMSGYAPREMYGKFAHELLLPPGEWEKMRARSRRRAQGHAEQYQVCLLNKERRPFWVEVQATPYCDADGVIIGTLGTNIDITARKEAEDRLRETTEELRRSNESLQDFASVASHDLQEPLRKIHAFSERLHTKYEQSLGDEGRDYLHRMQSAAGRMQSLINDLLLYSRVSSKAQPFQNVSLGEVVGEVLDNLELRIAQSGGRVEVEPLPVVRGDRVQLAQLFQNLVGNALKFHRPDETPRVTLRCEAIEDPAQGSARPAGTISSPSRTLLSEPVYRISVVDNGIGFEARYAERIFDVFERLNNRSQFEGTGMGLAICRRIVERHGGAIYATSDIGKGATFVVELPQGRGENE